MIRLSKIVPEDCADVLVKYEGVNIGGSIKTRTAYSMICEAEKKGIIKPDKCGDVHFTATYNASCCSN